MQYKKNKIYSENRGFKIPIISKGIQQYFDIVNINIFLKLKIKHMNC